MPKLPCRSRLPSIRSRLLVGAIALWMVIATPLAVFLAVEASRPWVLAGLLAGPVAFAARRRPALAAASIVAGALILRIGFIGLISSDPIAVSQLAASEAFSGGNPYTARYLPDQLPYPYGPAGLVTYLAGIPGEVIASVATSAILAWSGAWITLAVFNSWPQFIYMPIIGNNDFSVGFLTLAALVLIPRNGKLGMALLALAVAIKPYAAAWALPAAIYAGFSAAAVGVAVSLVLWSPVLLVWGVSAFIRAASDAEQVRARLTQVPSWSLADLPVVRWIAVPLSLAGVLVRSWRGVVFVGAGVFVVFLGFAPRAPQPYLAFLMPIVGMALETSRARFTAPQRRPS